MAAPAPIAGISQDVPGKVDVNPSLLTERLDSWLDALVTALPNIAVAICAMVVAYIIGRFSEIYIKRKLTANDRADLGDLVGGLVKWALCLGALALSATLVFPSLSPGDLFAGLGVSSVAIGFAFKDILQNWLAGLLLLIRRPFHPGDQIEVSEFEGTVEHVETRSTFIRTYDGQLIVIPNSEVYTKAVLVKTQADVRRSDIDIKVGFRESMPDVRVYLRHVIEQVDGVVEDPSCDVLMWDIGTTSVTLKCRWWTRAFRADVVETYDRVVSAIHNALSESDITRPMEAIIHLNRQADEPDLPLEMQPRATDPLSAAD